MECSFRFPNGNLCRKETNGDESCLEHQCKRCLNYPARDLDSHSLGRLCHSCYKDELEGIYA